MSRMIERYEHAGTARPAMPTSPDLNFASLAGGACVKPEALRSSADAHLPNVNILDSVCRETELLSRGLVGGALKEAQKDPAGTALKAATAVGVGAVLGVAATAASPLIAGTAVAVGVAGTGAWLWGSLNTFDSKNVARNNAMAHAISETWSSSDRGALNSNIHRVESAAGKDALDLGLGLLSGVSAGKAAQFVPGLVCREAPSVGFKFFSQHAIERAFPTRVREFEIAGGGGSNFAALDSSAAVRVPVRELLHTDKHGTSIKGPERQLIVAHRTASSADALPVRDGDLVATCRPDLLEPMLRAKSILQHAADVEMQVNEAAGRLRFLTVDKQQSHGALEGFTFDHRFILGEQPKDVPFTTFIKALRSGALDKTFEKQTLQAIKHHDLREIHDAFPDLPYQIAGLRGAGAESLVFDVAGRNDVVLKISNPKYGDADGDYGLRPFDAKLVGEMEYGKRSLYVAYLQEFAEPIPARDLEDLGAEFSALEQQIKAYRRTFYDRHNDGQLGRTNDGRLVVIDWYAVLRESLCVRPEALNERTSE